MTDEQKAKCHKIADHYGENHQMLKAVEEMAELTRAIVRFEVNESADYMEWESYVEELADVMIMIEQLVHCLVHSHGSNGAILFRMFNRNVNAKLDRQLQRMESESDE